MIGQRRIHSGGALVFALGVVVLLCALGLAWAQQAPARASVAVPAVEGAKVVMLDLSISAPRSPAAGNVGGVVRLRRAGGGQAIEVGRFSIFGAGEQSYQFNVASALKQLGLGGGQAEVEVMAVDRSNGTVPAHTALAIGRAQIVTR